MTYWEAFSHFFFCNAQKKFAFALLTSPSKNESCKVVMLCLQQSVYNEYRLDPYFCNACCWLVMQKELKPLNASFLVAKSGSQDWFPFTGSLPNST